MSLHWTIWIAATILLLVGRTIWIAATILLLVGRTKTVCRPQAGALLPKGVKAVWDMDKAYHETTSTHERICINGLWRWKPADPKNDWIPVDHWGYFKVPRCWPGITNYMQKECQTVPSALLKTRVRRVKYSHNTWTKMGGRAERSQRKRIGSCHWGCSLHILRALEAACKELWGDVYVVRINPFAVNMDVDKVTEIPKVERVIKKLNGQRKAVYGMKLLGGANPHIRKSRLQGNKIDESLRFVLRKPYPAGFTIGFSQEKHIDDIMQRIRRVQQIPGEEKS